MASFLQVLQVLQVPRCPWPRVQLLLVLKALLMGRWNCFEDFSSGSSQIKAQVRTMLKIHQILARVLLALSHGSVLTIQLRAFRYEHERPGQQWMT